MVFFIMFKVHGETFVEHPLFILSSVLMLLYAPFWMAKAIFNYEE